MNEGIAARLHAIRSALPDAVSLIAVSKSQPEAAVRWFRESHRLQPDNWTYRRQAWSLVDPGQGPTEQYDGDWLTDVRRVGAEHYYAPLELEPRD